MIFIWCQRGATSWDWQIGRVWLSIIKPQYRGRQWWKHLGHITITDADGSVRDKTVYQVGTRGVRSEDYIQGPVEWPTEPCAVVVGRDGVVRRFPYRRST